MTVILDGQGALFDAGLTEDDRVVAPVLECPYCGREEGNTFTLRLNHGIRLDRYGIPEPWAAARCVAQELTRNQALYAQRMQDPAVRAKWGADARCHQHPGRRRGCEQACFDAEAERAAARATSLWHGNAWQDTQEGDR